MSHTIEKRRGSETLRTWCRVCLQQPAMFNVRAIALAFSFAVMLIGTGTGMVATAQESKEPSVVVQEGETIRDIAGKYLQDPDLWEEILRFNHIDSVTAVVPGTTLTIPATKILRANRHLNAARVEMQRATEAGANVFAQGTIGDAVRLHNAALSHRKAGDWEQAAQTAQQAKSKAQEAFTETMSKRNAAAEAILSDRRGAVQGQKPTDLVWNETPLNSVLVEQQKVRTLSQSLAEILFQDENRLRLNENSQAIIRSIRIDRLSQKEEAKVSLVSGDVYALLRGSGPRKTFKVDVQGVEMKNTSQHFWVGRGATAARVANYDTGRIQVTSAGATVTLGKNQGTVVKHQQKPGPATELLERPELAAPGDNESVFQHNATLTWGPVVNAVGYWLEIALDPMFQRSVVNRWGVNGTRFSVGYLEMGVYYWRVSAIDSFGFPGVKSRGRRFSLQSDTDAPYLMIASPEEGGITRQSLIRVAGVTEQNTMLQLNGQPVDVGSDGRFELDYELQRGVNDLVFNAIDKAGYVTRRVRPILYLPDQETVIRYDPSLPRLGTKHFLTQSDTLSLSGTTTAKWQVQVQSASGQVRANTFADGLGHFRLNIPIKTQSETFRLLVISPSGFVTKDEFMITKDQESPTITVDELPPPGTRMPEFRLRGRVRDADVVQLNSRVIALSEGRFDETIRLEPGRNRIELTAIDPVGNEARASWIVLHDIAPPELVSHRVSRNRSSGSDVLIIEVVARDPSGLKQAAPYRLQAGDVVQSGFLELNKASQIYQAITPLPRGVKGSIRLKSVELEDYVGNRRAYAVK